MSRRREESLRKSLNQREDQRDRNHKKTRV
jgi:hypothetical protein